MFDNHIIPPNVSDMGSMLSAGTYRRVVEAAAITGAALLVNFMFLGGMGQVLRISVFVVMMLPVFPALTGIYGKPLTVFLSDYLVFRFRQGFFPYRLPMPMVYTGEKKKGRLSVMRKGRASDEE